MKNENDKENGKENGVTLLELMVVIAIIAIVVSAATPAAQDMVAKANRSASYKTITSALALTRSEAVNLQQTVTLCGSNNLTACNTTNWEEGMVIFADDDADGTIDGGENIIRVFPALKGSITLRRYMRRVTDSDTKFIRYARTSMLSASDDASNFVICDEKGPTHAQAFIINNSGQIRIAEDGDANHVVELIEMNGAGVTSSEDVVCP